MCSSSISSSGGRPRAAHMTLVMHLCCLNRALMTGVPSGTRGALSRYEHMDRTVSKFSNLLCRNGKSELDGSVF